ncbi:uncharacterized protein LOC126764491 [Bactrocera neohumeralis]|uniref:uncharacterized protein LOC126764491 n=1 Tax=Bactrocera neohumeralis TaxID=98809 RepID=UPI002165FDD7|nr:uncharacterized protein LOC126764491 [Bactrocera neohumeralis]
MKKTTFQNHLCKEKRIFKSKIIKYKNLVECAGKLNSAQNSELINTMKYVAKENDENSDVVNCEISNETFRHLAIDTSVSLRDSLSQDSKLEIEKKANEIRLWAIRNNISQNSLEDLLKTLRKIGVNDLPLSAKPLLNTGRQRANIKTMSNGEFLYIGIQNFFLSNTANIFENLEEILIDIGIDGLKLFKSSNRVLWPIIGAISNLPNVTPFLIACFSGFKKPDNINSFMAAFCSEVKLLRKKGIQVGQNCTLKKFYVSLFSCDTPARVLLQVLFHIMVKMVAQNVVRRVYTKTDEYVSQKKLVHLGQI